MTAAATTMNFRRDKRVRRLALAILAAASLLVFASAVALCARSYWISDFVDIDGVPIRWEIITARGQLLVRRIVDPRPTAPIQSPLYRHSTGPPQDLVRGNWLFWTQSQPRRLLGIITWGRTQYGRNSTGLSVMLPYWLIAVVSTLAPALWAIAWRRGRARQARGSFEVLVDLKARGRADIEVQ